MNNIKEGTDVGKWVQLWAVVKARIYKTGEDAREPKFWTSWYYFQQIKKGPFTLTYQIYKPAAEVTTAIHQIR